MKYIVDFFDSLKKYDDVYNIEFSTANEQIQVALGEDCYYFLFNKRPDKFRSNLCREIFFINEQNHHVKLLKANTPLNAYFSNIFESKNNAKNVEKKDNTIRDSNINEYNKLIDQDFISNLEKKLANFDSFSKMLLKCKIEAKLPEKSLRIARVKI